MSRGILNLGVFVLGLVTIPVYGIGLLFLIAIAIVEIPALFRSQTIVKDHNNKVFLGLLEMVGE